MFLNYNQVEHLFIIYGKTDLRKGIDGLASIVQHEYNLDIYVNALFVFCGGKQDRFKMLNYEKDGFLLLYKRLDQEKIRWSRTTKEIQQPFCGRQILYLLIHNLPILLFLQD